MAGTIYVISVSGPKMYKQDAEPWWETGFTNTQMWQAITIEGDKLLFRAYDASGSVADQFVLTRMKNGCNRIGVPSDVTK